MHSVMEGASSGGQEKRSATANGKGKSVEAKVVEWEEFQDVLARMCGRGLVMKKALVDREALKQQLEAVLEVFFFSSLYVFRVLGRTSGMFVSSRSSFFDFRVLV